MTLECFQNIHGYVNQVDEIAHQASAPSGQASSGSGGKEVNSIISIRARRMQAELMKCCMHLCRPLLSSMGLINTL